MAEHANDRDSILETGLSRQDLAFAESMDQSSALHDSAASCDLNQVDRLLREGADPNELDANHRTPLHEAVDSHLETDDSRSYETVNRLLEGGANPNLQDAYLGHTALHRAVHVQSPLIAERLLQSGADPNLRDGDGDTPLHAALKAPVSEDKHLATVNSLIAHGARLDLSDKQSGCAPLSLAAATGKIESAFRLLEQNVYPNSADRNGYIALHLAAQRSPSLTQTLIQRGASPHYRSETSRTPLHEAASYGATRCADQLLDAGADPNCREKHGQTPLHLAASAKSPETVDRLLQAGADPNQKNEIGWTPLHSAAVANNTQTIDRLLKAGADMRSHEPGGVGTPLELARTYNKAEAVGHLARAETIRDSAARSIGRQLFRHVTDRLPKHSNDKHSRTTDSPKSHHHRKENTMPQEHWSNSKNARQFTEQVATRVAGQIEKGTASFQKGYDKPKGPDLQPFNPATGKRFKGLNSIQLKSVAQEKGYNDPRWMSFQTANRVGAKIRKGERGTRVEYLRFPPKTQSSPAKEAQGKDAPNGSAGGEKEQEQPKISHHTYVVFNAEQIERMPSLEQQLAKEPQQHEICERAEKMIQDSNVKIDKPPNEQEFANYDKDRDTVVIPNIEKFKSPEDYYGHAVKEMASRAGHEQQKNRPEPQSEAQQYNATARHEMRREMATDTIAAKLHLPKQPTGDKCKQQWAETIRKNPNELRYAARDADRMADKVLQHDRPHLRLQSEPSRDTSTAQVTPERVQETQRSLQQQPEREMPAAMSR